MDWQVWDCEEGPKHMICISQATQSIHNALQAVQSQIVHLGIDGTHSEQCHPIRFRSLPCISWPCREGVSDFVR